MPESSASMVSPLSLRAKGIAVLAIPLAALLGALYWTESAIRDAEAAVLRATEMRAEVLELEALALDRDSSDEAIGRSIDGVEALGMAGEGDPLRAAARRRRAVD